MTYDIIIPDNYKYVVASAIAGKKLTGLNNHACRDVIDAIAELARGSAELFGLVASLNMQYICQNSKFKPAEVFEEADIAVGNIYLIHNKLVLIRSTYKNHFTGVLVVKDLDIIVDCKRAMLIGSFNSVVTIPQFDIEMSDCYILHTPALGVFWGFSHNDLGEEQKVQHIKDADTVNEGIMHFNKGTLHDFNFKLLITRNPNGKNELIEKLKSVIESEDDISLKWFDFDEMELFHVQSNYLFRT